MRAEVGHPNSVLRLVNVVLPRFAVSTKWERDVAEGRAQRDVHTYFCCCARRIGHMFALLSYPDGSPLVIAGPCWPFCVLVTLPLVVGISGLVMYFLIIDDSYADLVRRFA